MNKTIEVGSRFYGRSIVPFTGGLVFPIYAFFWPAEFGHWFGTIIHGIRTAGGF